jgi:hypothetical protein
MKIGHIEVYGINKIIIDEKAVWKLIRDRWVKYIGNEAKDGKTRLEMHEYLNGIYWAVKPIVSDENDGGGFKIVHKYGIGINGDTIHIKRLDKVPEKKKKPVVKKKEKTPDKKTKKTKGKK